MKAKNIKTTNPTTKQEKPEKTVRPWHEEYYSFNLGKTVPVNDDYLEKFGLEFVAWCKQQKYEKKPCTCLEDFYELKDINVNTVDRWRKRNEKLDQCINHGKVILGNLRENGVNRKEFSHVLIERSMHAYKPSWNAVDSYWAEIKKQEHNEEQQVCNIYVPKLGDDKPINRDEYELINHDKKENAA